MGALGRCEPLPFHVSAAPSPPGCLGLGLGHDHDLGVGEADDDSELLCGIGGKVVSSGAF